MPRFPLQINASNIIYNDSTSAWDDCHLFYPVSMDKETGLCFVAYDLWIIK
jgi:hypothetical protein